LGSNFEPKDWLKSKTSYWGSIDVVMPMVAGDLSYLQKEIVQITYKLQGVVIDLQFIIIAYHYIILYYYYTHIIADRSGTVLR